MERDSERVGRYKVWKSRERGSERKERTSERVGIRGVKERERGVRVWKWRVKGRREGSEREREGNERVRINGVKEREKGSKREGRRAVRENRKEVEEWGYGE